MILSNSLKGVTVNIGEQVSWKCLCKGVIMNDKATSVQVTLTERYKVEKPRPKMKNEFLLKHHRRRHKYSFCHWTSRTA